MQIPPPREESRELLHSIINRCSLYNYLMSLLIEKEEEESQRAEEEGIPICSANLTSPVVDTAHYIGEIHYKIGSRLYIENAD